MNTMASHHNKTRKLVLTSLLFAIALVLSVVENSLPPIMISVPGVKFGLSNIAVMYALFFTGKKEAFTIATLKAFFVFITRSAVAALLSFCGGMLSIIVMSVLIYLFKERISYLLLSVCGAVFHNVGQFIVITVIYTNLYLWVYLPVLLISGILAGIATATLLKLIMPALKRLA